MEEFTMCAKTYVKQIVNERYSYSKSIVPMQMLVSDSMPCNNFNGNMYQITKLASCTQTAIFIMECTLNFAIEITLITQKISLQMKFMTSAERFQVRFSRYKLTFTSSKITKCQRIDRLSLRETKFSRHFYH